MSSLARAMTWCRVSPRPSVAAALRSGGQLSGGDVMAKLGSRRTIGGGALCALLMFGAGCQPPNPWRSSLESPSIAGDGGGDSVETTELVVSPDGTQVAFASRATNLAPGTTVGFSNVFLRDLASGTTTLVSRSASGPGEAYGDSAGPVFSPDGTKLAFVSRARDIVPLGTTVGMGANNVYVYEIATASPTLVSVSPDGTEPGNAAPTYRFDYGSDHPVFSPDGTRVAFESDATNLTDTPDPHECNVTIDPASCRDVFVRDLSTGVTGLVSLGTDGTAGDGASVGPAFSPDGAAIAFHTSAQNVAPGAATGLVERDLGTGITSLVVPDGGHAGARPYSPMSYAMSGSEILFVAFPSDVGFPGVDRGLFSVDRATRNVAMVSPTVSASGGGTGPSNVEVSPDGTQVLFTSDSAYVGVADVNGGDDVFVSDLVSDTTAPVSVDRAGTATGDGPSRGGTWSPDGSVVAFSSLASDLDPAAGQAPGSSTEQVYVRDLLAGATTLVSTRADGSGGGDSASTTPRVLADGRIAFLSAAQDLDPGDDEVASVDVFVARTIGADLSVALTDEPDPVTSGGTLVYTLTVEDRGPDAAEDVTAAVLLPDGVVHLGSSPSIGSCAPMPDDASLIICTLGLLPVGTTAEIAITASVTAAPATELRAVAVASSPVLDPTGNGVGATTVVAS